MNFEKCMLTRKTILMEGALGERLKREYGLTFDEHVAMAKLIYEQKGAIALTKIWNSYIDIARKYQLPFVATTPTRRANQERVEKANSSKKIMLDNVKFLRNIQQESEIEMYVGGLLGCKGDAYTGYGSLTELEAEAFHGWQAEAFAEAGADFLYAAIMPTLPEAAGMAKALARTRLPYIISFTIQSDGKLIDGTTISDAIQYIDANVPIQPVCYMTNCVHPRIVYRALSQPFNQTKMVQERFRGIQANTSPLSYAELDGSIDLKCSEPEEFAREMMKLTDISRMKIWGGCCGTDDRHMECVAKLLCE